MLATRFSAFGAPEKVIELFDEPDPGEPGPGEVVIDTEFVPINPADLLNLEGQYGASKPKLPMTPGAEGVGKIVKLGDGVKHVQVGDHTLLPGPGCWRARVKAPAKAVFALPAKVDPQQLSMLRVNPPTADLMLSSFVAPKAGNWVMQNAANSGGLRSTRE